MPLSPWARTSVRSNGRRSRPGSGERQQTGGPCHAVHKADGQRRNQASAGVFVRMRIIVMTDLRRPMRMGMKMRSCLIFVTMNMEMDAVAPKTPQHVQPKPDQHDTNSEFKLRLAG